MLTKRFCILSKKGERSGECILWDLNLLNVFHRIQEDLPNNKVTLTKSEGDIWEAENENGVTYSFFEQEGTTVTGRVEYTRVGERKKLRPLQLDPDQLNLI